MAGIHIIHYGSTNRTGSIALAATYQSDLDWEILQTGHDLFVEQALKALPIDLRMENYLSSYLQKFITTGQFAIFVDGTIWQDGTTITTSFEDPGSQCEDSRTTNDSCRLAKEVTEFVKDISNARSDPLVGIEVFRITFFRAPPAFGTRLCSTFNSTTTNCYSRNWKPRNTSVSLDLRGWSGFIVLNIGVVLAR
ncbi:hypothetical protein TCAL_15622 [Tigriopus californicus]|uniref:Uncharacterized protein n=1 Tax=Tigriopus californicus TaxID=6832 RepID=A0A553PCJ1_TIGCA|nr:hypothetical protein TCAL_15622 [Tigriopus californicus]